MPETFAFASASDSVSPLSSTSSSFIANSFEREIHNFIMPQPIAHSLFYFLCKFRINTNTSTNPNTNCFPFLRVNKQNEPSRHRQRLGQMFVQKKRREIRKTSRILCRKTGNKRPATRPEPTTPTTTPEKLEEGSTQHQNKNRKLHKHFCILEIVYFKIFCTLAVLFNFAHVETTSG